MTSDGCILENRMSPYANEENATRAADIKHPNIISTSKRSCKPDLLTPY